MFSRIFAVSLLLACAPAPAMAQASVQFSLPSSSGYYVQINQDSTYDSSDPNYDPDYSTGCYSPSYDTNYEYYYPTAAHLAPRTGYSYRRSAGAARSHGAPFHHAGFSRQAGHRSGGGRRR